MTASNAALLPRNEIRIQVIRGARVTLNMDLAALLGLSTKRLNEQVKRNRDRLLHDFLFQLSREEKAEVGANCDHLHHLNFSKVLPFASSDNSTIRELPTRQLCRTLCKVRLKPPGRNAQSFRLRMSACFRPNPKRGQCIKNDCIEIFRRDFALKCKQSQSGFFRDILQVRKFSMLMQSMAAASWASGVRFTGLFQLSDESPPLIKDQRITQPL